MNKYYRDPSFVVKNPSDYNFAFTMRLLNTLYNFNLVRSGEYDIWAVQLYARRFPRYYVPVDKQEES